MYAKVFTSMWDGSLYGKLEASAVLMACVTLCNADGVLDMTQEAIAGRTGWPIEFIRKGIDDLQKPDPRSRTPDDEGRRLALIDEHRDWGWLIVNYRKYRTLSDPDVVREQTRNRVQRHREQRNGVKRDVTDGNASKRQALSIKHEEGKSACAQPPPKKSRKPIKTSLPEDLSLTPDLLGYVAKTIPDADAPALFEKFREQASAKGWEYADWGKAFQTYCRNAAKDSGHFAAGQYPKRGGNGAVVWR